MGLLFLFVCAGLLSGALAADCTWTPWLSRDTPGSTGDWETPLSALGAAACPYPLTIEGRRKSDQKPAYQTGEILRAYNSKDGLICVNNEQPDGRCDDYEVRMCCPESCKWTTWFDRDNPSGSGDWEHPLSALGSGTCNNPARIEGRRKSDKKPADQTGEVLRAYDTKSGLICVNNDQPDRYCDDYEVRLLCCPPDCAWTSWFDRDNPSGTGDYENPLSSLGTGTCTNPLNIEGRRKSDKKPAYQTGEVLHVFNIESGLVCKRDQQPDGKCDDYEVSLCCP